MILAGLAFDSDGNLWTQSYVNLADPYPDGGDYIIRIDKAIHHAPPGDISNVPVTYYTETQRGQNYFLTPKLLLVYAESSTRKVFRLRIRRLKGVKTQRGQNYFLTPKLLSVYAESSTRKVFRLRIPAEMG